MKRIVLAVLSTVSAVVLLFGYRTSTSSQLATAALPAFSGTAGGTTSSGSSSTSTKSSGKSSGTSSGSSAAGKASGTATPKAATTKVTGAVAATQWGPVQVALTVKAGSITQVDVVQYPNGNPKDAEINDYALPILIQETTKAQSASIDMVSGATVTSTGYLQSLQSALDKANL